MFPFEQGAFEMVVIGALALIIVGPKDLPVLMRKVGQFTAKMRGMAAEFRASFDELARQSELDELRREVEALRTGAYVAPSETASLQTFEAPAYGATLPLEDHGPGAGALPAGPEARPLIGGETSGAETIGSAPGPEAPGPEAPGPEAQGTPAPRVRKPRTPRSVPAAPLGADGEALSGADDGAPAPRRRARAAPAVKTDGQEQAG
jgi:sec-independent protein translocase protein TatB